MAKAIGYSRVSTADQAESGLGLEAQRERIEAAAERSGLQLGEVFTDAGVSGSAGLEDRPGLFAALEQLGRGDVLLVAKRDRIARDPIIAAMVERTAQRKGARVVSAAGEGTDDDDPASILMRRMVDAFAEYERLLIGQRTKAALAAKKKRGERAGNLPFGFRDDGTGRLVEEPGEQEVIGRIAELRAAGLSLRAVVAELRSEGLTSRSGKPLGLTQVARIDRAERAAA